MTKAARTKGSVGELEARDTLRKLLGDDTIQRILEQSRDGGPDLQGRSITGLAIEVKRVNSPRLLAWFDKLRAAESGTPVIMLRKDRGQWRYFVELDSVEFRRFVKLRPEAAPPVWKRFE